MGFYVTISLNFRKKGCFPSKRFFLRKLLVKSPSKLCIILEVIPVWKCLHCLQKVKTFCNWLILQSRLCKVLFDAILDSDFMAKVNYIVSSYNVWFYHISCSQSSYRMEINDENKIWLEGSLCLLHRTDVWDRFRCAAAPTMVPAVTPVGKHSLWLPGMDKANFPYPFLYVGK